MEKIYAVNETLQKDLVDKYCFGECGKINIGVITLMGMEWLPCKESNCPHIDNQSDFGEFIGRKLLEGENEAEVRG